MSSPRYNWNTRREYAEKLADNATSRIQLRNGGKISPQLLNIMNAEIERTIRHVVIDVEESRNG